ncbi:MAG: hypothetical protein LBH60_07275 [Prevotellaceae bacterium]|jgi:hypothetical protein|nr:hypothetical protein [Prevotellaceae bacterium]
MLIAEEKHERLSFNFDVCPYRGKGSILSVLKDHKDKLLINQQSIHNSQFTYLESYFREIEVKTIIYEFDYNDKGYIEDFSSYYCRSFKDYPKKCVRLHFFTADITYNDFKDFIKHVPDKESAEKENPYNEHYAGFAVLRPIPLTLFGRTCLKTYNEEKEDGGKRFYSTVRDYKTHLFGIEFSVKSIAFQEQDDAVSACATTALWVAFQKTSQLFEHLIPAPYDITLNASKYMMPNNRKQIPYNEGLSPYQMAYAITQQGLQTLVIKPGDMNYSKAEIYAYLKCGIPVIMGVNLYERTNDKEDKDWINKDLENSEIKGRHAVTVVGYDSYPNRLPELCEENRELCLVSSFIKQVYVHDDQIGAFARMEFEREEDAKYIDLDSSWKEIKEEYKDKNIRFRINVLIFPLYHKIRIRFYKIYNIIKDFSSQALSSRPFHIVWDIYLTTVCDFKKEIRKYDDATFAKDVKLKILTNNYPRYLWVADARIVFNNGDSSGQLKRPDFSLHFDATDIDNSDFFLFALHFNPFSYYFLRAMIEKNSPAMSEKRGCPYQLKRIIHQYKDDTSSSDFNQSQIFYKIIDAEIDKNLKSYTPEELLELIEELKKYFKMG